MNTVTHPTCALGVELTPEDQKYVLAKYPHWFTKDHVPAWAKDPREDGRKYNVQFGSDADWLANTRFAVRPSGRVDTHAHECESHPTWPDNPELRLQPVS